MQEIPALITDLTIILVVAALTTLLCKKINLPSVLGYILAGFLAGPVVQFLPTIEELGGIEVWSDIGVIFLDINGLKDINDGDGYSVGDAVLAAVSRSVS